MVCPPMPVPRRVACHLAGTSRQARHLAGALQPLEEPDVPLGLAYQLPFSAGL